MSFGLRARNLETLKQEINYPGIGIVLFEKSRRARRFNIRIRQNGNVRVAVPYRQSFEKAQQFFKEHLEWVSQAVAKQKKLDGIQDVIDLSNLRTRNYQFLISEHNSEKLQAKMQGNVVEIRIPSGQLPKIEPVQVFVKQVLIDVYRREAKELLPRRVQELADKYGLHYNKVYIKNLKSRWGSCSVRNNINLNLQLMRFDDEVIDYIILHELLHTKIKNHSRIFWYELSKIYPEVMKIRKKLKSCRPYIV